MAELLNIAVSGLLSHQAALNVTGQNITNASTEGYSRQRIQFETRPPDSLGGYFLGTGVDIQSVKRVTDEFTQTRLRNDSSATEYAQTLSGLLDQMDLLFSSPDTGLTGTLERVYGALQTAADDPTSVEARQVLIAEANALTSKFTLLNDQLGGIQNTVNSQVRAVTATINDLAADVALLNEQILAASSGGAVPNDLLDQRDLTLRELSKLAGINVVYQDDGMANVFIGSGQGLVIGSQAFTLQAQSGSNDPEQLTLSITVPGAAAGGASAGVRISSGTIGALLTAQEKVINSAFNNIGLAALGVAEGLNSVHRLGMDLEGNLAGDFLTNINTSVAVTNRTIGGSNNSLPTDQVVDVSISDISRVTTSDYVLTFTGATSYSLSRISDGATNAALDPSLTGSIAGLPASLTVDGLTIDLDRPSGNFAAGDTFRIRPTRDFSALVEVEVKLGEQVALALPIRTDTSINNTGSAVISAGTVTDTSTSIFSTTPGALSPPVLIRFTGANSYDILNATTSATISSGLPYPPTAPAGIIPTGVGLDGIQVEINGTPAAGDEFNIVYNTGGVQDNRNGLALAELQIAPQLFNGTATIDEAYGIFIQEIGTQTRSARVDVEASQTLLAQTEQQLQEISGVNLDEEAARLIEYEQVYSAAAQMVAVSRSIFDTLLSASRT